jgi:hypothetical protein
VEEVSGRFVSSPENAGCSEEFRDFSEYFREVSRSADKAVVRIMS